MKQSIEKAISIVGSQSALAQKVGVKQPTVSYWLKTGKMPAENVINVENATKRQVSKHDLRPDIFGPSPTGQ